MGSNSSNQLVFNISTNKCTTVTFLTAGTIPSNAWTHVNAHFGDLDWRSILPTNLTPSEPVTVTMSDATHAGLILAGFSQLARTMAEASALSPGTSVTGATLAGAAGDDATDGTLTATLSLSLAGDWAHELHVPSLFDRRCSHR
jgi:hypothetical protein